MAFIQVSMMAGTLGRTVPVYVILPTDKMTFPGMPVREEKPYKTLYLLHGILGSCVDWVTGTRIQRFAEEEVPDEGDRLDDSFTVRIEDGVYVVEGSAMEHLINSVNFDDDESVNWFHRTLRRKGIIDELRRQGAGEGSTVRIDDMEFDFVD